MDTRLQRITGQLQEDLSKLEQIEEADRSAAETALLDAEQALPIGSTDIISSPEYKAYIDVLHSTNVTLLVDRIRSSLLFMLDTIHQRDLDEDELGSLQEIFGIKPQPTEYHIRTFAPGECVDFSQRGPTIEELQKAVHRAIENIEHDPSIQTCQSILLAADSGINLL